MKEKKTGKPENGSRNKSEEHLSAPSAPRSSGSAPEESASMSWPVPGLSKKTRPELVALALSLGLSVAPEDRRIDLIERIRSEAPGPHAGKGSLKEDQKTVLPAEIPVAEPATSLTTEESLPKGSPLPPPPPSPTTRSAAGWKDFLDIPYEPVRRERGHFVTILPISPYRIMAFFSVDRGSDLALAGRIDASGLVLKIRDVTGAVSRKEITSELPADHVFDIMAGMADRWNIPLWSAHRWMEAWLGFYDNGSFRTLARSKRIRTPRGAPSPRTGTLFHLKEAAFTSYSPTELHGREVLMRYHINLPTSTEIPASTRNP